VIAFHGKLITRQAGIQTFVIADKTTCFPSLRAEECGMAIQKNKKKSRNNAKNRERFYLRLILILKLIKIKKISKEAK
jgi:hypothetical protein